MGACSNDDAAPVPATTDAAVCGLFPANYDDTCATDSDCVYVPFGGNVCDDCQNAHPSLLYCAIATLPATSAARYKFDLQAAMGQPAFVESKAKCGEQGCPSYLSEVAQCIHNQCVIASPDAGADAGVLLSVTTESTDAAPDAPDAASPGSSDAAATD
jgi:hypothetical protein